MNQVPAGQQCLVDLRAFRASPEHPGSSSLRLPIVREAGGHNGARRARLAGLSHPGHVSGDCAASHARELLRPSAGARACIPSVPPSSDLSCD